MDLGLRVNRLDYWNLQREIPYEKYQEWLAWTTLEVERKDPECASDDNYLTPGQLQVAMGHPVKAFNGRF